MNGAMTGIVLVLAIILVALIVLILRLAVVAGRLVRRVTKLETDAQLDREERAVLVGEVQQAFSAWDEAFKFDGR